LATDVLIAEAMAEAGAERLAARGLDALILPGLAYTHAGFAVGFPGTISARAETVAALMVDIATSLHRHGIATLALANAHLDPDHLAALHAACEAIRDRGLMTIAFPDLTKRPWGGRLTDEFRSGAAHAGQYEGSILMACAPRLVREEVQRELEPIPISLSASIAEGKRTFQEAGGERAYFGYPARATAAEGEETISILGGILEEAVLEAIGWNEDSEA
jgi:creatinine amidohydrolase